MFMLLAMSISIDSRNPIEKHAEEDMRREANLMAHPNYFPSIAHVSSSLSMPHSGSTFYSVVRSAWSVRLSKFKVAATYHRDGIRELYELGI